MKKVFAVALLLAMAVGAFAYGTNPMSRTAAMDLVHDSLVAMLARLPGLGLYAEGDSINIRVAKGLVISGDSVYWDSTITTTITGAWTFSSNVGMTAKLQVNAVYLGDSAEADSAVLSKLSILTFIGDTAVLMARLSGAIFTGDVGGKFYDSDTLETDSLLKTKKYIDDADLLRMLIAGGAFTGDVAGKFFDSDTTKDDSAYVTRATIGGLSNQILLSPEYPGAVLYDIGAGSADTGTLTATNTYSEATNRRNYYSWYSAQLTLNKYDIVVRVMLPGDFKTWDDDTAIVFTFQTEYASADSCKVDVTIYEQSTAGADASSTANTNTSWTNMVIDNSVLGDWNAAYEVGLIHITLWSCKGTATNNYARIGDIKLKYNR